MGFFELLGRLPRILAALKTVTLAAIEQKPDVAIVIDYPDFHFRLARRLKRLGVPVVYYIPPKVWVWRKGRIKALRETFTRVLSILPFEVPFYEKEKVAVRYVGNPLIDELPLTMTRQEAREKLGLRPEQRVLVLLPGSRPAEVKQHLALMLDSTLRAAAILRSRGWLAAEERLTVLMPFPMTANLAEMKAKVDAWLKVATGGSASSFILDVRVTQGDSAESMLAADAGLIKSGTSTLEAALLECPHTIVYRGQWFMAFVFFNVLSYIGPVGLPNLVAGWEPGKPWRVKELLARAVNVPNLTDEILVLLTDERRRAHLKETFSIVRKKIFGTEGLTSVAHGEGPSIRAAREVMAMLESPGALP